MDKNKIVELENDIEEIKALLNEEPFNQNKAISIIEKHKSKDGNVALVNSPLTPNFVPYRYATDDMLRNNVIKLLEYLSWKLLNETGKA